MQDFYHLYQYNIDTTKQQRWICKIGLDQRREVSMSSYMDNQMSLFVI